MLIIFRNQNDMEIYKSKVNEIISSIPHSIISYKVQFSEQYQSNHANLQYSENSNIMSSMKYFIKYDKVFNTGLSFHILNMDSLVDDNQQNDVDTYLLLTILNHTMKPPSQSSENEAIIMNAYEMVGELWECNKTWGPCFDFINSCLTSSNALVLINNKKMTATAGEQPQPHGADYINNFPHHFLLEVDDTASDYSLDGGLWSISLYVNSPVATTTTTTTTTAITTQSIVDTNVVENDMKTDVNQIQTNIVPNFVIDENENDNNGDGDWEMVADDLADLHIVERIDYTTSTSPPPVKTTTITQQTITTIETTVDQQTSLELPITSSSSLTFTYKDMVLKPETPKSTYSSHYSDDNHDNHQISLHGWKERQHLRQVQNQQHEWKPHVVLIKTPYIRQDREYGSQPDMLIDDEGNGCWDLVDAQAGLKYNTAIAKRNKVTMLTLKVQEQKEKRIAERAK